jgi:hypothetical protein
VGFNTVAMILNDHMHELEKAPQSLAYALCNPPFCGERAIEMWRKHFRDKMEETGERISCVSPLGGLNILPTFHADDVHFLYAGKNTLERLEFLKFGTATFRRFRNGPTSSKTVNTVTLALPDWWSKDR